ncbi:Diphthine methyl ester synthase [Diplonema papillatum]|nr:Diphthine methyl ester synthase [Diplonema papillatum]|eukprot:gene19273-29689_t
MVFHLVGLGLGDEKDITLKGLEVVKRCHKVYLEAYTSILLSQQVGDVSGLTAFYGREVVLADREFVESGEVLEDAADKEVALLVVGDPFGATTHSDLVTRCNERKIKCEVVHNSTIMSAVGVCGLQLYRYGQAVSLCFWTDTWKPESWYDKVLESKRMGLHCLLLLDIKVKEQSIENMARGRKVYEPPRFMTVQQAAEQVLAVAQSRSCSLLGPDSVAVGLARVGCPDQLIVAGTLSELAETDFGTPLHSMVIPGDIHEAEEEHLSMYYTPALAKKYNDKLAAERTKHGM